MKNYLPIGSIVLLKEGTKPVMIYGRKMNDQEGNEYDYLACLYPEGYIDLEYTYLFNEENIAKVLFRGYVSSEDELFVKLLNEQ